MKTAQGDILDAALAYAARGWAVLPTLASKRPATSHGVRDASTDPGKIGKWFDGHAENNVAIATGQGLAVLDIDAYKRGCGWPELEAKHGRPETYEVRTPRGGTHFYFAGHAKSRFNFARFVELRSDGYYILAPPSRTPDGFYVVVDSREPAPLPLWVGQRGQTLCCLYPCSLFFPLRPLRPLFNPSPGLHSRRATPK